jgi:hypothetical protein
MDQQDGSAKFRLQMLVDRSCAFSLCVSDGLPGFEDSQLRQRCADIDKVFPVLKEVPAEIQLGYDRTCALNLLLSHANLCSSLQTSNAQAIQKNNSEFMKQRLLLPYAFEAHLLYHFT